MADSKARAELIEFLSCFAFVPSGIFVGSQGGSCRFGLGRLARRRTQLHAPTSHRLHFLQQDHKPSKMAPIAA
jgi:hypothetical protein